MTQEEILEGNKLIAEFMGWKLVKGREKLEYYMNKGYSLIHKPSDFKYNSSWDWLMPVVEKIEKTNIVIINGESCEIKTMPFSVQIENDVEQKRYHTYENYIANRQSKILAVWLAVVEFIKWYNQNKNK